MSEVKIYEDNYTSESQYRAAREEINTPEQIERADFYVNAYRTRVAEIEPEVTEWEKIQELYECEREKISDDDPNSFVAVILPNVEGQVAAMTEKFISASVKGEGVSDQKFAKTGQRLTDFAYRNIKIKGKVKAGIRRYLKFGNGIFSLGWDPDALDGFGLPDWRCPSLTRVFVDGKIKDIADVQKAEYIIEEVGNFSILSAKKEYGDKIADAITLGNTRSDFDGEATGDDRHTFTKLIVWTRNNEDNNLQKLEISLCGVMLKESDPKKPYYKYVFNQYPFEFFGMYPKEGKFYRFGDGKALLKLQKLLNNLYDEVVVACKFASQSRTFIDPNGGCDTDEFDNDPSHPILIADPTKNVHTQQGMGMNQIVFQLISNIMMEVQKITRFSALMAGNSPGNNVTATQAGIQIQQGNSGVDDKRNDISEAIAFGTTYIQGLMMEFWPAAKAMRITEDSEDFEWVEPDVLTRIPAMVPSDTVYEQKWRAENPHAAAPKYMQLHSTDTNEPMTKQAIFDIQVSIGEGLPTSKMALYNIVLGLSKLVLPDETTGQMRPLLSLQQVQSMIEDILGIPLKQLVTQAQTVMNPNQNVPQNNLQQPMSGNPYIEGANQNMSNQPMGA